MTHPSQKPEGVKGFMIAGGKKASKQYGTNRACAEEGCTVLLSRYNPGKYCSQHENPRDKKAMAGDGRSAEAKWKDVDSSLNRGTGRSYPKRGK